MHTLPGVFYCFFPAIDPSTAPTTGMSSVVRLSDIVPGNYRLRVLRRVKRKPRLYRNLPVHPICLPLYPAPYPAIPAKLHMGTPAHSFIIIPYAPGRIKLIL